MSTVGTSVDSGGGNVGLGPVVAESGKVAAPVHAVITTAASRADDFMIDVLRPWRAYAVPGYDAASTNERPLMAGASLIALLDDIATVLDDVAVLTKLAARKTAGVLGDDLALNAEQVSGVRAERELPVVWAVAKGSAMNKAILVPAALAISALAPWAVIPLLMIGGAFLCFEGFEKLAHRMLHGKAEDDAHHAELTHALSDPKVDLVALEKDKIKGAVRTDFILSAEIIVISLGAVAAAPFVTRLGVLVLVAIVMTVGVYGLVAGIVRLDDAGLYLSRRPGRLARSAGSAILRVAPYLMKTLSVAGTAAMFLVGGAILAHGVPPVHHAIEAWTEGLPLGALVEALLNAAFGIAAGAAVLAVVGAAKKFAGLARHRV
jgi:predicted DNA repair protein MutK